MFRGLRINAGLEGRMDYGGHLTVNRLNSELM
jgi:hypothetical protein